MGHFSSMGTHVSVRPQSTPCIFTFSVAFFPFCSRVLASPPISQSISGRLIMDRLAFTPPRSFALHLVLFLFFGRPDFTVKRYLIAISYSTLVAYWHGPTHPFHSNQLTKLRVCCGNPVPAHARISFVWIGETHAVVGWEDGQVRCDPERTRCGCVSVGTGWGFEVIGQYE